MPTVRPTSRPRRTSFPRPLLEQLPGVPGFTLIELLLVISIISIVVGLSFPYLRATLRNASVDMAVGHVNNGVAAARAYATRHKPFLVARRVGATLRTASDTGDGYSGAIALFATDGTVRVLENDENAWASAPANQWMEMMTPVRNGYSDIENLDDLTTPGRSFLLGIVRTGSGNEDIRLIPPPFAIRFSRDGVLTQGNQIPFLPPWARFVYISGAGDTRTFGTVIANDYDITAWRGAASVKDDDASLPGKQLEVEKYGRRGDEQTADGRTQLPFDSIETVSGVLVVDPEQIPLEWDGTTTNFNRDNLDIYTENQSAAILKWAAQSPSGRVLFFNRYTGQDLTR